MKKLQLILGILLTALGAFCLLLSGLFWFISMNTHDAPASLYHDQYVAMLIFLIAGLVFLLIGIICLVRRRKKLAERKQA